jgi:hypothetical protein
MLYKITNFLDWTLSYVYTRRLFGPRCVEHMDTCVCCEAWKAHDEIFN